MLGEGSRTSLHLVILRDLPHTYSCTYFIHQKVETNKDSTGFKHRGFYTLFNEKKEVLEAPNFIFIFIFFIFFYLYFFVFLGWQSGHDG